MGPLKVFAVLLCLGTVLNAQAPCTTEGQVRIVSTVTLSRAGTGRVEVCLNGVWGTVAAGPGSLWSEKNAQVACRQAGYSGVLNTVFTSGLSAGDIASSSTPVHFLVSCNGLEDSLTSCIVNSDTTRYSLTATTYIHIDDAFVVCRPSTITYSAVHPAGIQPGDIRLLGFTANGVGAVEIYSSLFQWTTICPDGFDDSDASALCSRLGYDSGQRRVYSEFAMPGGVSIGRQLFHDADCSGNHANIGLTTSRVIAGVCSFELSSTGCPSGTSDLAGVECFSSSASQGSVRLFGGDGSSGVVETLYDGRWGMVCGSVDRDVARAICSELGYHPPSSSRSVASSVLLENESNLKPIWLSNIMCPDGSTRLSECSQSSTIGYSPCTSNFPAVMCEPLLSTGEIVGIIIGVPAGLVVVGIFVWFIFFHEAWKKRASNPRFQSCVASWTGCKRSFVDCCSGCIDCRTRCQEQLQDAREARAARREEREAERARREGEREAQRAQREAEREAQREVERARQAEAERIRMESIRVRPSAPPEAQPYPTKESEISKEAPPQYPMGIGFQQVAADLPPPYIEATAGNNLPYPQ